MNAERLHLLIVENEESHIEAIRRAFEEADKKVEIHSVGTLREYRARAKQHPPDLALVDLNLPDGRAVEVLTQPPEDAPFPILVMSAFGNQQIAVEVMKAGALDYVVKSPEAFATLPRTVEQSLREWTLLQKHKYGSEALQTSERRYRTFMESSSDLVFLKDESFRYLISNAANNAFLGKSEADVIGHMDFELMPEEAARHCRASDQKALKKGTRVTSEETVGPRTYQTVKFPVPLPGGRTGVGGIIRDITKRKQTEESLRASEEKTRSILENIGIGVALISPKMEILELNRQMKKWFPDVDPSHRPICFRAFNQPPRETACDYCPTAKTLEDGQVHEADTQTPTPRGVRQYRIVSSPILDEKGQVTAAIELVEDVTEKRALESQLQQAQKMESVGRLAGGVAHDFNNMLGVILGRADMALAQTSPALPLHADLQEIQKAAERSADLTRQLLAFARKQTVSPKVLDLNGAIESMLRMLQRLIGENITLSWKPRKDLWPVRIDPSQVDQILANLCVNARDAIAGVGSITIETDNATFDPAYCAAHPGFFQGEFVQLSVRDTGAGMDPDTLSHIFEPFFTTKELGAGTGLGLATVYGAIQQNNGFLHVSSGPGQETTFQICLPRHRGKDPQRAMEEAKSLPASGHETILLVEDEPSILNITTLMLQSQGYAVLPARIPGEAIRLAREHRGEIDLLLTDVVMPEMNGRDLAKNVLSIYPELKRLFMSGYTADVIAHQGVLDEGVNFIQKPFTMQTLATKVREALDA